MPNQVIGHGWRVAPISIMVGPTLMESYIICIKDLTVGPTSGPYFNFIDDTNPLVLNFHVIWDRPKFDHII